MPPQSLKSLRYRHAIDLGNRNDSSTLLIEMVGTGKRVLEVGSSTGYMTRILREMGNSVVGVEIDAEAAAMAEEYCEAMLVGDIEELDLGRCPGSPFFDVVMFGDVLEHLRWPWKVLEDVKKYLKPGGYVVASIPNACHGDVLLNLLRGDVRYMPMGLLDQTHIRFFGRKNIPELFEGAGYSIVEMHPVRVSIGSTELKVEHVPVVLQALIGSLPDSDVYQYVLKAAPGRGPSSPRAAGANTDALLESALNEWVDHFSYTTVRALEAELSSMKRSVAWRMALKFEGSVAKPLLPDGSRRRRIYNNALLRLRKLM